MAQALVQAFAAPAGLRSRLEEIALIPSGGGCYEVSVDGKQVYSKRQTGRHIADSDAVDLIRKAIS